MRARVVEEEILKVKKVLEEEFSSGSHKFHCSNSRANDEYFQNIWHT
jgi:hypothetical protein